MLTKLVSVFRRQKNKHKGAIAFVTIILSGLIISVGIGMVAILAREIQFSTDLVISEKSYFAAESGVEIALMELKENPVEYVDNQEINLGNAYAYLTIENLVDSFELELKPLETRKFRLKVDSDETLGDNFSALNNFSITRSKKVPFWWKILCKKQVNDLDNNTESMTISLQGYMDADKGLQTGLLGNFDNEKGEVQRMYAISDFFEYLKTDEERESCFLSLTNLGTTEDDVSVFTIAGETKIAPYRATVKSVGKVSIDASNKYQKTINFFAEQEGLSSFFDFGLFQK